MSDIAGALGTEGSASHQGDAGAQLGAIARRFRDHRGRKAKASLSVVHDVLGPTDWARGPGDDAAVVPHGDDYLVVGGEAVWPPLVAADPRAAGIAAVVTNVNDIAAMGGGILALVDQIVAPAHVARRALEGLRDAARLYGVAVVGGHLTVRRGAAFVAASAVGRAARPLAATNVRPGQSLVVACATEGRRRDDFPFFSSLEARGARLADDVGILRRLAEEGACAAAKDVSMAGLLGSLAMLLEPTRAGAMIDLGAVPRPPGIGLADWCDLFPTYGFILAAAKEDAPACCRAFAARGLAAAVVGAVHEGGSLRARLDGDEELLTDLVAEPVTGLHGPAAGR
jgi:selenophosphate synthetase-related protein